jgi:hypothetical protein
VTIWPDGLPESLLPFLARGLALFPVRGKVPLTPNGFKDASTDPVQLLDWYHRFPGCGWAAPTGAANGFDVLDADDPWAVEELEDRLPQGPRVRTGGGGMHFYLMHSAASKNWTKRIPGVDFRADGGYVVLAGSRHASGQLYGWIEGTADLPLPDTPAWVAELQRPSRPTAAGEARYVEGERNDRLFRMACAVREKGGDVLAELQEANGHLCFPPLSDAEVQRIAASASRFPPGKGSAPTPNPIGDDDESPPKKRIESYLQLPDGRILEEILTQAGPSFVEFTPEPEAWRIVGSVEVDGVRILPRPVDSKLQAALTLADGLEEYESVGSILSEIERLVLEIFDPRREGSILRLQLRLAVASWVIGPLFPRPASDKFAPIIQALGPAETGKGRLLKVHRAFFYRPLYMLKTVRVPSVFRAVEPWGAGSTLILDEADISRSSESSEFVEFLNARSYGVPVMRYSSEHGENQTFLTFGYTILATRQSYDDAGFNSRTLHFYSEAAGASVSVPLLTPAAWEDRAAKVRRQLLLLRLRCIAKIRKGEITVPTQLPLPNVDGNGFRARKAFLPLVALSVIEPALLEDCKVLLEEITRRQVVERADSPEGQVLRFVHDSLAEGPWAPEPHGGEFYIKRTLERTAGEDAAPVEVLTLSIAAESVLGDSKAARAFGKVWKTLGQKHAQRRVNGRPVRGVLLVTDLERLLHEIPRYVPDSTSLRSAFEPLRTVPIEEQGEPAPGPVYPLHAGQAGRDLAAVTPVTPVTPNPVPDPRDCAGGL